MPSSRHSPCDTNEGPLTCEEAESDGCDGIANTRHSGVESAPNRGVSTRRWSTVTSSDEISPSLTGVVVHVPAEPPVLTTQAARTLLAVLVELTEVPVLDAGR
jgi:hypothetical protein